MSDQKKDKLSPKSHVVGVDQQKSSGIPVRQRLNPDAEVIYTPLSDQVGMKNIGVALGELPVGRESFVQHAHSVEEEFIYILSGKGTMEIGDELVDVEAGDFIGFPIDGLAHNLKNTGNESLKYLMGGDRTKGDVVQFPKLNKTMIAEGDKVRLFDNDGETTYTLDEWIKRD